MDVLGGNKKAAWYPRQAARFTSSLCLTLTLPREKQMQPQGIDFENNCRQLWLGILTRALADTVEKQKRVRESALMWLDSPDFPNVCAFAGLNAERLRESLAAMLPRGGATA
jgi:hypothetical protein